MLKTILIGLAVTVVGLVAFTVIKNMQVQPVTSTVLENGNDSTFILEDDEVKVTIEGEVNHPGDYSLLPNETLGTLINMAGGVTSLADPKAYNEDVLISTHTSFYIPPIAEIPEICIEETIEKVNINVAEEDELKEVGFNSSQAPNLIAYREENGLFEAIEEILEVKGIGEATFEKVKDKICLS